MSGMPRLSPAPVYTTLSASALAAALGLGAACGSTDQTGPKTAIAEIWNNRVAEGSQFGWDGVPAIIGSIIVVENENNLVALDRETGKILWSTAVKNAPVPGAVNVVASNGTALAGEEFITAVDDGTGQIKWRFKPDSVPALVIASADDQTYYTGQLGIPVVYALDLTTGSLKWRTNVGSAWQYKGYVYGTSFSGDTLYVNVERKPRCSYRLWQSVNNRRLIGSWGLCHRPLFAFLRREMARSCPRECGRPHYAIGDLQWYPLHWLRRGIFLRNRRENRHG